MDAPNCHACNAIVLASDDVCLGCGAHQTPEAARAHAEKARHRRFVDQWRTTVGVASVVSLCVGAGIGFYLGGLQRPDGPARFESREAVREALTDDDVVRIFVRSLNQNSDPPVRIVNWLRAPGGELVLEFAAPTRDDPATLLWESLDTQGRSGLVALLSVGHARALAAAGRSIDARQDGFPVIALRYYGTRDPLAVRARDGQIYVYASPVETLRPAAGAGSP
jgi:hypothetical protein